MPSTKIHSYDSNVPSTMAAPEPMSNHQDYNSTAVAGDVAAIGYHQPPNNYYNNGNVNNGMGHNPTPPPPNFSSYNAVVVTGTAVPVASVEHPHYVRIDSRKPVTLSYCPNCAKPHVTTHTLTKANGVTMVCVVAGVVVFWPLFWVPLVAKPMKQTNHYCQNCGVKVGRVKPFH
jgi:predicted RNA-binding Zn-ribbon protein involved in translation (DUF1610 family)